MFSISCNQKVQPILIRKLFALKCWGIILLIGAIACFWCFTVSASSVESVLLQYRDTQTVIPIAELKAFASNKEMFGLQAFLGRIPLSSEDVRHLLTASIRLKKRFTLDPTDGEFLAVQLNKLVGDPQDREPTEAVKTAIVSTIEGSKNLSILNLIEAYPKPLVRVELSRLEKIHNDVSRLSKRIQPLMGVINELVSDLASDKEPVATGPALMSSQQANSPKPSVPTAQNRAMTKPETPVVPEPNIVAGNKSLSSPANPLHPIPRSAQQIVFTYGPFQQSLAIEDLLTFTQTGKASNSLKFLLKVAKVNSENLRTFLTREVTVNRTWLDRRLNSILGEYILFQVGQIIHTHSHQANIQTLRAALVLAANDDNRISPLEFFQNYPLQQVYVDGIKLSRLIRNLKRAGGISGFAAQKIRQIKDFLVMSSPRLSSISQL